MKEYETRILQLQNRNTELSLRIDDLQRINRGLEEQLNHRNTIGWKGSGSLVVQPLGKDEFLVNETRMSKHSGEVNKSSHIISRKQVNIVLNIIRKYTIVDGLEEITYRDIVQKIIDNQSLRVGIDSFNGGHNRSKLYFPLYYYPLKILETKSIIKYRGSGKVILLKKNVLVV